MEERKILGVFQNKSEAIATLHDLKSIGYRNDEISVIAKNLDGLDAGEDGENLRIQDPEDRSKFIGGLATGGILGGIGALLLELGVFTIPGIGPIIAIGPIAATFGGLVTGGTLGGIVGSLVEAGVHQEAAEVCETYVDRGDILMVVDAKDPATEEEVVNVFYKNNSLVRDEYNINI